MILKLNDLKNVCNDILPAVDSTDISSLTETLGLEVKDNVLYLSVTNREYFVTVKLKVDEKDEFKATVNANLFLKLVSQTTSETIELTINSTNLVLKGNGTYKLPLIYDNDHLLELPKIELGDVTASFDIAGSILNSILIHNTKQLGIGNISKLVQKLYYVDEQGCLTFTSGACVNQFVLPEKVKLLFNKKLVKLFKLFKDETVKFTLSHMALTDDVIQTITRFETESICITAILSCDDTLLNSVPVSAIRDRATHVYPYSAVIAKQALLNAINRIKLVIYATNTLSVYAKFVLSKSSVVISDLSGENQESIKFNNDVDALKDDSYELYLDLVELQAVLETCYEQTIQFSFGDSQAVVISRESIINVIPEVRLD